VLLILDGYKPLMHREKLIPPSTQAYSITEVACVQHNPLEGVSLTDYKVFRIEFYKNIRESLASNVFLLPKKLEQNLGGLDENRIIYFTLIKTALFFSTSKRIILLYSSGSPRKCPPGHSTRVLLTCLSSGM